MKKFKNKLNLFHKQNYVIYVLILGLVIILICYLNIRLNKQYFTSEIKETIYQQKDRVKNNYSIDESIKPTPSITIPDFSNETIKPRYSFDITGWKTYINEDVGLRFKYPPEWGDPSGGLNSCDNPEICSDDYLPAKTFRLTFPNSEFRIGGASSNYTPHRGLNILSDFTGFSKWYSAENICKTPWFIFCQNEENIINYVSIPACGAETFSGFGYERVLLVNLPKNKVNGLAFGGDFIPKILMTKTLESCDKRIKSIIGDAIIDRKLNSEIMKSFDNFEKVFETIEIH